MTNKSAVEKQLDEDFNAFYNSKYDGNVAIPANTLDIFKKAVMALAPQFHKINSNKIKVIANTKLELLTIGDIKDVITIIFNAPFDALYSDFNEAMYSHNILQKFVLCYNNVVEDFNKKLEMKKATLTDLTRNIHPNGGNIKIVN